MHAYTHTHTQIFTLICDSVSSDVLKYILMWPHMAHVSKTLNYHVYRSPPFAHILRKLNPVWTLKPCFVKVHFTPSYA